MLVGVLLPAVYVLGVGPTHWLLRSPSVDERVWWCGRYLNALFSGLGPCPGRDGGNGITMGLPDQNHVAKAGKSDAVQELLARPKSSC